MPVLKIGLIGCATHVEDHLNRMISSEHRYSLSASCTHDDCVRKLSKDSRINRVYCSTTELLDKANPDAVYIMPQYHEGVEAAFMAIDKGCHVLMSNLVATDVETAKALFRSAKNKQVMLWERNSHAFESCVQEAENGIKRALTKGNIKFDCLYSIDIREPGFAEYPAPNQLPIFYEPPERLYSNILAEPINLLIYLFGTCRKTEVIEKSHGHLIQNISDELDIRMECINATGRLVVKFAPEPCQHLIKINAEDMAVQLNLKKLTIKRLVAEPLQERTGRFRLSSLVNYENFSSFLKRKSKNTHGGGDTLIKLFNSAALKGYGTHVDEQLTIHTIKTTDAVERQIVNREISFEPICPSIRVGEENRKPKLLITGATGFLGNRLMKCALERGYSVRVLLRKLSDPQRMTKYGVEVFFGDVGDADSIVSAMKGIDIAIHAAADTRGKMIDSERSTVSGTRNVIGGAKKQGVRHLIYISSCSVYGTTELKDGAVVDESGPLERYPEKRGVYTNAKFRAEQAVLQEMEKEQINITCIRPGTIWGPRGEIFTPMMGFSAGQKIFFIIGNGRFVLPLVFVDNLISALLKAVDHPKAFNTIFNVVDTKRINKRQYVERLLKRLYPGAFFFYLPYSLLYGMVLCQEAVMQLIRIRPFITRYRLASSQKAIVYDSGKIQKDLDWAAPYDFQYGIEQVAGQKNQVL